MKHVIFDIDGTLIKPLHPMVALQRVPYAIKKVFGKDSESITSDLWKTRGYNGKGDRFIMWDIVQKLGVTRDAFLDNIGALGDAYAEYLSSIEHNGPLYEPIMDAKKLVEMVIEAEHLSEGVLTGNLGASASWKLRHAGYDDFAFGVYGHEADAREDLARLLVPKAQVFYNRTVTPSDIIIVGDTVNDVLCARAIRAVSVIVHTGWNVAKKDFEKTPADLHVDSLLDERVLKLLGLGQ